MMANGYIHPVADGEITELRDFLLKNSYAMMALITMRDGDHTVDPPRQLEPDTRYYDERLAAAREKLDRLAIMSDAEREALCEAEYQEAMKGAQEFDDKSIVELERVRLMKDKVEAWEGGPEGYKTFLLTQLNEAIQHNSQSDYSATKYVKRQTPDDMWRRAVEAVGKAEADIAAEHARTKSRNKWLSDLWASVDALNVPA